ncbi:MAG TPA: response regulator transcription factor [Rubricoccaceae bacterium]|nr:response regulator transcription factor [Rubricoccaceae bacterium]
MPVRVVTIEDDARYRASLEVLLGHAPDFALAGAFGSPAAALAALPTDNDGDGWDLVLMDLEMPGMNGVEGTRRIKARLPDAKVVVLTVYEERAKIVEAICAGADGYLVKRTPAEQLLAQLRDVVAGGSPLSAGVARTVLDLVRHVGAVPGNGHEADRLGLTAREQEVLRALVDGLSYKMAADRLGVSLDTVRSHIRGVYGKLQVHSVAEAVGRALREGLV